MSKGTTGLHSRLCYHQSFGIPGLKTVHTFEVLRLKRNFVAQETAISQKLTTQLQVSDLSVRAIPQTFS